jgi:hypothetical protein
MAPRHEDNDEKAAATILLFSVWLQAMGILMVGPKLAIMPKG